MTESELVEKWSNVLANYGYQKHETWYTYPGFTGLSPINVSLEVSPEEQETEWTFYKYIDGGRYHLLMQIDNDGGENYAIFKLKFYHNDSSCTLKLKSYRGAIPAVEIWDIIESQVEKLSIYEEILSEQAKVAMEFSKKFKLNE